MKFIEKEVYYSTNDSEHKNLSYKVDLAHNARKGDNHREMNYDDKTSTYKFPNEYKIREMQNISTKIIV